MNQEVCEILFKKLIRQRNGVEVDFPSIERMVGHLRMGAPINYEDLEAMGDGQKWPFPNFWMWPCKEQIQKELKSTVGIFLNLPQREVTALRSLNHIFKNIALVSIILRFVQPKWYAIYSPPPLKVLSIPRGKDEVSDYLNYLKAVRALEFSLGVNRATDVDLIVWTIAHVEGELLNELKLVLAKQLPENLSLEDIIDIHRQDKLGMAEYYLSKHEYHAAGFWASLELEELIEKTFTALGGREMLRNDNEGELQFMIRVIGSFHGFQDQVGVMHRLRRMRNEIIHPRTDYIWENVPSFVAEIKSLKQIINVGQ
jgi:hypothetical protein